MKRILAVFIAIWAVNLPAQTTVDLGGINNDGAVL